MRGGGQSGVSKPLVAIGGLVAAIGVLVVVLLLTVGGAARAKMGPFGTSVGPFSSAHSTPSSGGGHPTHLTKPSDAKQAVVAAVGRTAEFRDVRYTTTYTFTSATVKTIKTTAEVSATRSPVMIDNKSTTSAGKKSESIWNGVSKVLCNILESGPVQRLPGQTIAADAADPFSGLVKSGTNWKFLDDVDLNGHKAWHLTGDITPSTGGSNTKNINVEVTTSEDWIDSRSGKIEKRFDRTTGSENGSKYERTTTYSNFVYDGGVTITPCK